jgi:hypothetical protein
LAGAESVPAYRILLRIRLHVFGDTLAIVELARRACFQIDALPRPIGFMIEVLMIHCSGYFNVSRTECRQADSGELVGLAMARTPSLSSEECIDIDRRTLVIRVLVSQSEDPT